MILALVPLSKIKTKHFSHETQNKGVIDDKFIHKVRIDFTLRVT
jgi:hypothetical protein